MDEVRWGFVGAGNVTRTKAAPRGAFTQARSRVVAVARADAARAQAYAEEHGIVRSYATVAALCADLEVNAVFVCTPHHLHTEHVLAAIRAGKHVLCEKPLTITTADGAMLVEAARAAGVVLGVAYYRRFYPVLAALKAIVDDGRLGTITTAQLVCRSYSVPRRPAPARESGSDAAGGDAAGSDAAGSDAAGGLATPTWRTTNATAGGGTLTDVGSHRLDLLFWLLGDAVSVSATTERFETWADGEDQATVSIRFANRASGHLDQSWCSRVYADSIALHGTHGTVCVPDLEGTSLTVQLGRETETVEVEPRSPHTHRPLVTDFVRALTEQRPVGCSGADALRTTQLIELAYQAAREGRTLAVPAL